MTYKKFEKGDPYYDSGCPTCRANGDRTDGVHYYLGLQEGIEGVIEGIHLGQCGRCTTSRVIPIAVQKIIDKNLEGKVEEATTHKS